MNALTVTPRAVVRCALCHGCANDGAMLAFCSACRTWSHADCLREFELGCPTIGCARRESFTTFEIVFAEDDDTEELRAPRRRRYPVRGVAERRRNGPTVGELAHAVVDRIGVGACAIFGTVALFVVVARLCA